MKHWLLGITFGLSMLCLMSYLDDSYEIKEIDTQELIEAQKAAKLEQAERKIERDYLMAKANWMTNGRGMK